MSREILFRGTSVANGVWAFGDRFSYNDQVFIVNQYGYEVIPETVGQYTGLIDKNGTKIFEGDIVKGMFLHMQPINAVVAFQDGSFGLEWYRGDIKTFTAFTSLCNVEYEVIGNIHENPELLN